MPKSWYSMEYTVHPTEFPESSKDTRLAVCMYLSSSQFIRHVFMCKNGH